MALSNVVFLDKYLIARTEDGETPFIKVFEITSYDGRKNIHIAFLGTHHHYSLHESKILQETKNFFIIRQDNQKIEYPKRYTGLLPLHFTSFDTEKESTVWDEEIERIATMLELPDPGKHRMYYESRLLPLGYIESFPLGGRRIVLSQIKKKKNYPAEQTLFFNVKSDSFFVETDFSIKKPKFSKGTICETSLGWFLFRII